MPVDPSPSEAVVPAGIPAPQDEQADHAATPKTFKDGPDNQNIHNAPAKVTTSDTAHSSSEAVSQPRKANADQVLRQQTNSSKGDKSPINTQGASDTAIHTLASANDSSVSPDSTSNSSDGSTSRNQHKPPSTKKTHSRQPSTQYALTPYTTPMPVASEPSSPVPVSASGSSAPKQKGSTANAADGAQPTEDVSEEEVDEAESMDDVSSSSSSSASSFRYESSTQGSSDSESSYNGAAQPRTRKSKGVASNRNAAHTTNTPSATRQSRRQSEMPARTSDSDLGDADLSVTAGKHSSSRSKDTTEQGDRQPRRVSNHHSASLVGDESSSKRKRSSSIDSPNFPSGEGDAAADQMDLDPDSEVFRVPIDCGIARVSGVKRSRNHTYTQITAAAGRESTHTSHATPAIKEVGKLEDHTDGSHPATLIFQCYSPYFGGEVETFRAGGDPYHSRVLFRAAMLARKAHCSLNRVAMYLARQRGCATGVFQAATFSDKPKGCQGLKAGGYFVSIHACEMYEHRSVEIRNRNMIVPRGIPEELKHMHKHHTHTKFARPSAPVDPINAANSALMSAADSLTNAAAPSNALSAALNSASLLISRAAAVVSQARASFNSADSTHSVVDGATQTTAPQDASEKDTLAASSTEVSPAVPVTNIPPQEPADKQSTSPVLKHEHPVAPIPPVPSSSSAAAPDLSLVKQEPLTTNTHPREVLITIDAPYKWSSAPAHLLSRYHLYTDGLPTVYPVDDFPSHLYADSGSLTMQLLDDRIAAYLSERFCLAKWQARKKMRLDRNDRAFDQDGAMTPSTDSGSDNSNGNDTRAKMGLKAFDGVDTTGATVSGGEPKVVLASKRKRPRNSKQLLKMEDISSAVQMAYPHLAVANAAVAAAAAAPLTHQAAYHSTPPYPTPLQAPTYASSYPVNMYGPNPHGANPMYNAQSYPPHPGYGPMPPYGMPPSMGMQSIPPNPIPQVVNSISSVPSPYSTVSQLSSDPNNPNYYPPTINAQPSGTTKREYGAPPPNPYAPWSSTDPNYSQPLSHPAVLNPYAMPNAIGSTPGQAVVPSDMKVPIDVPPNFPPDYRSPYAMRSPRSMAGKVFEPLHRQQPAMNYLPPAGMPVMNNQPGTPAGPYHSMPMYRHPPPPGPYPYGAAPDVKLADGQQRPNDIPHTVPSQYSYYHMPLPSVPPNL